MIAIKQQMDAETQRAQELGLNGEELAFYDAVASNFINLYNETFLRELVHDVVQTLKRNLKVDWTEPHRQDVQAAVRAAVKTCAQETQSAPGRPRAVPGIHPGAS